MQRRNTGWIAGVTILSQLILSVVYGDETAAGTPGTKPERAVRFPTCQAVIDVTQAPYFAAGDGQTDDTQAIQRALDDVMGQHRILYFPQGTYLISATLRWSKHNSAGKEAWGMNWLQGESSQTTTLRLRDATFTDAANPQSMMWCGGFGSADWFHNYVQDLTFDVGQDNPGATALQFYSNNSGAVRNCRFVADVTSGSIGLDLSHRDMNGPLLVRNCEVIGFDRGVSTGHAVNSQTLEYLHLRGQKRFGLTNEGQTVSIRGLTSINRVPAIQSYGAVCLIEADLRGDGATDRTPAIINYNYGSIYLRDVVTSGYARALADLKTPDAAAAYRLRDNEQPETVGPAVKEYVSHPVAEVFEQRASRRFLPVQDPPEPVWDDPRHWANVDDFGADPTAQRDSSAAVQRAIDSGAATIFFPGSYLFESTVVIRGAVSRLIGAGSGIDYESRTRPDFRIIDGQKPQVAIEHFSYIHGGMEIDTSRTVIFRSVSDCDLTCTPRAVGGTLYCEDFVTHDLQLNGQKLWARQLNIENQGTHLRAVDSDVWILGYKTERGGTLLDAQGGRSEILGGFSYTTTAGNLAPMFVTRDTCLFTFFREICFNGDPFVMRLRATRAGQTQELPRGDDNLIILSLDHSAD